MLFILATVAWATATICCVVAMIAGFDAAVHAALLIMLFACGVQIGSLLADRRKPKGGGR